MTARQAFQQAEQKGFEVISIGITNQRETMLIWERDTLAVIYPAIVWQDRRTAELRKALKDAGHKCNCYRYFECGIWRTNQPRW